MIGEEIDADKDDSGFEVPSSGLILQAWEKGEVGSALWKTPNARDLCLVPRSFLTCSSVMVHRGIVPWTIASICLTRYRGTKWVHRGPA